jgi:hypothetical protein
MNRVSNITSPADFALEHERESLRDRRSRRHGRMLLVWSKLVGSAAGLGLLLAQVLPILRGVL